MKALCVSRSSYLFTLFRGAFPVTRTQITFSEKLFFFRAKFDDSSVHGSLNSMVVTPATLAAEKKQAKSVLASFLKRQGLSGAVAARTINKSDLFISHLVSRLHSVHKSRYLVGGELTTLEIRNTLIPYLESLLEEHGNILVDLVENFPNPLVKEKPSVAVSQPYSSLDSKKPKVVSQANNVSPAGYLRPQFLYLIELGMDLEQIKVITRKYPNFVYHSLEGKIKPVVEFLLDLGVPKSEIPSILIQRPQLCGLSLSKNLIPTMIYLENLGLDKKEWAKVMCRFPGLLCYSRQKVQAIVDFLHESRLSAETIGKILSRWPNIISCSVEDKLRPTVEYFQSLGVDVAYLLRRCPHCFGLSIEGNLKLVTEFFLVRGFSVEQVRTMVSRYAALYTCSLTDSLIPKWEFFLTMGYSKLELVKFPQYFSYSLEERIKPRYALVKEGRVKMPLNPLLSRSGYEFEELLKMKRKKMLSDKGSSGTDSN